MNKRAIAWTQSWKELVSRRLGLRGSHQQRDPDFERAGNNPDCGTQKTGNK